MKRVLLVKPSSLGDIVHALPVAVELSRRGMEVHFAARREYRELLEMCPAVSKILDFPGHVGDAIPFLKELRMHAYDRVIDLQGLLRSALATACARTSRRLGLPDSREGSAFFYNECVDYPVGTQHAVDRYLSVLNRIPCPDERIQAVPGMESVDFGIAIPPNAVESAAQLAGPPGYVVFSPTTRQDRKMWSPESWAELAMILEKNTFRVVLIGHGGVRWPIKEAMWINLIDRTTLPVLCGVLSRARLCVSVDSAPMHLAAALGIPVVALFGPTDPLKVGPYTRHQTVLTGKASRMADLTPEGVASAVLAELGKKAS